MTRLFCVIMLGIYLSHISSAEVPLIDLPLDQKERVTQYFSARYPRDQSVPISVIEDRCQFDLTQYLSIVPVGDDYARTYYESVAERWSEVATERSRVALAWCISATSLVMREKIESGLLEVGFEYSHYSTLREALSRRFVALTLADKQGAAFDATFIAMLRESYQPDVDISVLNEYAKSLSVNARQAFYEVLLKDASKNDSMYPYVGILRRKEFRPSDGELTALIDKLPGLAEHYLLHFDTANVRGQNICLRKFRDSDYAVSTRGFYVILEYLSKDIADEQKNALLNAIFAKMKELVNAAEQSRPEDRSNDIMDLPCTKLLNYASFLLSSAVGTSRRPVLCIANRVEEIAVYLTWIRQSADTIPEQHRGAMMKRLEEAVLRIEAIKEARTK